MPPMKLLPVALFLAVAQDPAPHPWTSFADGSRVKVRRTMRQGPHEMMREETETTIKSRTQAELVLTRRLDAGEPYEETVSLAPVEDGFRDTKTVKTSREKLSIGEKTYDTEVEELETRTGIGRKGAAWRIRLWRVAKLELPTVFLQGLSAVPASRIDGRIVKIESLYLENEKDPDTTRMTVLSLGEEVKVGDKTVRAAHVTVERRMEGERREKSDAWISAEVPGHVVKSVTTLESRRMAAMSATVEALDFEAKWR